MNALSRFLGDSPVRVVVKLAIVSFVVGVAMAAFGLSPWDLLYGVQDFLAGIWHMGFDALYRFWHYFLLGAVVVVPLFVILRVLSYRR